MKDPVKWQKHKEATKISCRKHARKHQLRIRYGMTLEDYEKMLIAQKGLCAMCGKPETRKVRGFPTRLSVDHCHKTGRVRKLLCNSCNNVIGRVGDNAKAVEAILEKARENVKVLINAVKYLQSYDKA